MTYQALARKYRPQNFQEIVGQEHVVQALVNGLENNRLHHAFLFTGTRGVGKTTLARVLAKSLNCLEGVSGNPCGQCAHCQEIKSGAFIDLIEVDAASRTGVDDTRTLLENVQYAPSKGRYKIYLIDEVHMFSKSSFNALLKTLEEPPEHVKFLLATTEPDKLPVTVLSRCLQFNLKRLTQKQIAEHLKHLLDQENIPYDEQALFLIARVADGSMRDALSLLDQSLAFGGDQISFEEIRSMLGTVEHTHVTELLTLVSAGNHEGTVEKLDWLHQMSIDPIQVLEELCLLLHEVTLIQQFDRVTGSATFDASKLKEFALEISAEQIQLYYQLVMLGLEQMQYAPDKKVSFEMAVIRMLAFDIISDDELKKKPEKQLITGSPLISPERIKSGGKLTTNEPDQLDGTNPYILSFKGLSNKGWLSNFSNLPLKGSSRELARNFELLKNENGVITFAVDEQAKMFLSDKNMQVIEQVLQVKEQGFKLDYELMQHVNSVAVEQSVKAKQQQRAYAPHNDSVVSALQQRFGATVIENKFGS